MSIPVYVDFDDVLCETARTLARIVSEQFGRKRVRFADIHSFQLDLSFGLTSAEQAVLFTLFHDPDVLSVLPPVPGAVAGMQQWHEAGCRVEIVTGRPPDTVEASMAWLDTHEVPCAGITFVDKYRRGHGMVDGVQQVSLDELFTKRYALMVDDSPSIVRELAEHAQHEIVLFDRPWNQCVETGRLPGRVIRCKGWTSLLRAYPAPGRRQA